MRGAAIAFARLVFFCSAALASGRSSAENEFPYIAYVDDNSAVVRSGPGTNYYATDALTWATKVEVYEHEDDQWAAIRPPSSSFSWIPAAAITISGQPDLAIVESTTKTMIGSQLNDRSDVEVVTLQKGDVVEILGQADLDLGEQLGVQPCFKILPPAGEFRWIRRGQLALQPPIRPSGDLSFDEQDFPTHDEQGSWTLVQYESAETEADEVPLELLEPPQLPSSETTTLPPVSPDSQFDSGPGTPDSSIQLGSPVTPASPAIRSAPPAFGLPAPRESGPRSSGSAGLPSNGPPPRRMPLGPASRMRLDQELTLIEMELTQQLAQPPESWELSDFRIRARAVIDTSDQAEHRATAQRIIAKVAQLEDLKRRNQGVLEEQDRLARLTLANSRYAQRGSEPLAPTDQYLAAAESSYDGVGWLMPVVTDHPSIPRYVLTDAEGNIKQFVSPKPGMNLSRFEQKRIAIYGQRGYLPTYDQPHLMAERIISLDKIR